MNSVLQASGDRRVAAFGGDVPATNLDLGLATVIALGLPFAAAWLFERTGGALLGLLLYYGVCWAVPRWRKGTWDYRWPARWPWPLFGTSLLVPLAIAAINWGALPRQDAPAMGFLVTFCLWAPLNAATEQLSWQYVLDSWRNRWPQGAWRRLGLVVGVALLLVLVGMIHVLFWSRFLPAAQPTRWSWLGIPLNLVLTATYVLLYYRARSMWPVFWVHLLADLQLVLLAHYSIVPDL
jgi:hypothetical protein